VWCELPPTFQEWSKIDTTTQASRAVRTAGRVWVPRDGCYYLVIEDWLAAETPPDIITEARAIRAQCGRTARTAFSRSFWDHPLTSFSDFSDAESSSSDSESSGSEPSSSSDSGSEEGSDSESDLWLNDVSSSSDEDNSDGTASASTDGSSCRSEFVSSGGSACSSDGFGDCGDYTPFNDPTQRIPLPPDFWGFPRNDSTRDNNIFYFGQAAFVAASNSKTDAYSRLGAESDVKQSSKRKHDCKGRERSGVDPTVEPPQRRRRVFSFSAEAPLLT
jgi:hypothetical protein